MKRICILLAGLVLMNACARSEPLVSNGSVTVVEADALPAPTRTDLSAADRPYLIGPFDKITVDVFGVPDLSKEVQADASGRIAMPLIGTIDASGQTPAELANTIAGELRGRFVRNPQVTVNLKETVSQVITLDGEVREPGLYPVIGRMSLMRAIATAKGTAPNAKLDDVVVFRTVEKKRLAALYNLDAIRRGSYADPEIFANDIIIVGDSPARRLFRDLVAIAPTLLTPLVILLQ